MGAVRLLRELLRHRVLVAVTAVLAVAVGVLLAFRVSVSPPKLESRQYTIGVASASALVDTPSSQVVDLGLKASAAGSTLPSRAALLASLLTASPLKEEIAKRAGIDPRLLIATAPAAEVGASGQKAATPLATGATVSPKDRRASTIELQTDVTLPIITVNVTSQDPGRATRLANATVATLEQHVSTMAGQGGVPDDQRLLVKQLGQANAALATRGGSTMLAGGAGIMVFLLGCGAILGFSSMAREWRRTAELEKAGAHAHDHDDDGDGAGRTYVLPVAMGGEDDGATVERLPDWRRA